MLVCSCFFSVPAASKRRRLRKLGETASAAEGTPAADEPQRAADEPQRQPRQAADEPQLGTVPPAGEHRAEVVTVEEATSPPARAASPPTVEHRAEEVIEVATPPPTRAATPPAAEHRAEEEVVDEEIVMEPPPETEGAPTRRADAPEAAADAATTEGAGSAPPSPRAGG